MSDTMTSWPMQCVQQRQPCTTKKVSGIPKNNHNLSFCTKSSDGYVLRPPTGVSRHGRCPTNQVQDENIINNRRSGALSFLTHQARAALKRCPPEPYRSDYLCPFTSTDSPENRIHRHMPLPAFLGKTCSHTDIYISGGSQLHGEMADTKGTGDCVHHGSSSRFVLSAQRILRRDC